MNKNLSVIFLILVIAMMLGLAVVLAKFYYNFSRERFYLKEEIRRAGDEWERKHYQHKLQALYISLIPGISRERAAHIVRRRAKRE